MLQGRAWLRNLLFSNLGEFRLRLRILGVFSVWLSFFYLVWFSENGSEARFLASRSEIPPSLPDETAMASVKAARVIVM